MKTIFKYFNKTYPLTFFKDKEIKENCQVFLKDSTIRVYFKRLFTPLNYYQCQMILKAKKNKSEIEKTYDLFRNENIDVWHHLTYPEKNTLFNPHCQLLKKDLIFFEYEGVRVYVPFFNITLNRHYDTEMAIFDLKQYYDLYFEYSKQLINLNHYQGYYYQPSQSFAQCSLVLQEKQRYVLVDPIGKCLSFISENEEYYLDISNLSQRIYSTDFTEIANAFIQQDKRRLFNLINEILPMKPRFQIKVNRLLDKEGL